MKTFGEKIAELRKSRSMKQEEFAGMIGVSAQSVSKWENNTTMPDIMLLPVIAGIFEISIDELFSVEKRKSENLACPMDDTPTEAYMAVLEVMQRGWYDEVTAERCAELAVDTAESLKRYNQNTGIMSYKSGSVYANKDMAVAYLPDDKRTLNLFENDKVATLLRTLGDKSARLILKHQLEHNGVADTPASLAAKCGTDESEIESALGHLVALGLNEEQTVDVSSDASIKIYRLCGKHRFKLIAYPLLCLAGYMVCGNDVWRGLRG